MDYATTLKTEAEKTVAPLAERAQKLEQQRAKIADRIRNARDDLARIDGTIGDFKAGAAEKLTASTSAYAEWQGRLRRLVNERQSAAEALALLDGEVRPQIEKELETAKREIGAAVVSLVERVRPDCEKTMAEHIAAAIDARAAYLAAARELFAGYGMAWSGESFHADRLFPKPRVLRPRNDAYLTCIELSERPVDKLHVPPHPRPPEAAPGPEKAPQAAPGATNGERADTQDAPDAPDPEKKATTLLTGATPEPAGMDPDADTLPPDLDAPDAPPDAGEKNLGIAPDCA